MARWVVGLLASALVAAPAAGQDKAEDVVKKAIEAHGGKDLLTKLVATSYAMKGTLVVGGQEVPFTGSDAYQVPGKSRQELTLDAMGMKVPVVVVVNGDKVSQ